MTTCGPKKCLIFPPFRRRLQAEEDRKFWVTWINRMVTKRVEKQIAELRSELPTHRAQTEEMVADFQWQLRELRFEAAGERSRHYTRGDFNDGDTSSQPATCEEEQKQQSPSADTNRLVKESKKESPMDLFYVGSSFDAAEVKCEEKRVQMERTKVEVLLTGEMRGKDKVELVNQQKGPAPPAPQKPLTQNVKEVNTLTKMKTCIGHLFNPHTCSKWERLEEE
ncbi:hypothetical protein VZT92_019065 [Zoarces viviparus]|uniref:Uncharacterized protein n=1 Tax=Zoarces viviparus TaxID=48416 RepID=A0AAW1EL91_ZOAVI